MAGEKRYYQTAKNIDFIGIKENKRKSPFYDILRSHEQTRGRRADWVSARLIRLQRNADEDKHPHAGLILIFSWRRIGGGDTAERVMKYNRISYGSVQQFLSPRWSDVSAFSPPLVPSGWIG